MTVALGGLVAVYAVVIYAGKHSRRLSVGSVLFLMGAAALQVAVILYVTHSAKMPILQ